MSQCQASTLCPRHPLPNGYCVPHQSFGTKIVKPKYEMPKVSEKKKAEIKEHKPVKDLQNQWFAEIEETEFKNGSCNCWNCGEIIYRAVCKNGNSPHSSKEKKYVSIGGYESF